MGNEICCMNKRPEIYSAKDPPQINRGFPQIDDTTIKIIKIQSAIRGYLSKNKFNSLFNSTISEITKELDKKKLINESIILESESHLMHSKLISKKKITPFLTKLKSIPELHKIYLEISRFAFIIPNYIVTSPTEVYKGYWNTNKKYHGHGVKYEFDEKKTKNKRTEGIFYNGLLLGQGIIVYSNGEILQGNFIRGKMNGNGEHVRKDGSVYKGVFKNGKYDGLGKEFFDDGTKFEGFFSDGQKKYGTYQWKNGSKFQGQFLNGLFHGKGVYNWANKKTYDGNWINGKMNGKGKFTYQDGSYYEGEFVNGKKNGYGIYKWDNDKYYEGKWKNDKQNGYGVYYDKNKVIKGFWIDGKIRNRNGVNFEIKKNQTFIEKNKEYFDKKGVTQEYFYKRYNLSERKEKEKSIHDLNFNPTFFDKDIKSNFISHLNINAGENNNGSLYSDENINSDNKID
jgi:hypothetical protein